jgi:predicted acetyltransferase
MRLMNILIVDVLPEDENILQNMFEFYDYEFSQYLDFEVNKDGLFRKAPVSMYISDNRFKSHFIKSHEKLLGFVIVKKTDNKPSFEIEQFFVLNKYNGKGVGKQAAFKIFDQYRGDWKVTQIEKNYSAQAFWRNVIKNYTNNSYSESYDEKRRAVQEFQNG